MRLLPLLPAVALALSLSVAHADDPKLGDKAKATAAATAVTDKAAAPAKAALLDINSASEAELDALPGVGEARVKKIIAGRPWGGKDDLVKKKVIPKSVYDKIKDQIIAKQSK